VSSDAPGPALLGAEWRPAPGGGYAQGGEAGQAWGTYGVRVGILGERSQGKEAQMMSPGCVPVGDGARECEEGSHGK
jgi:hypothetical protein